MISELLAAVLLVALVGLGWWSRVRLTDLGGQIQSLESQITDLESQRERDQKDARARQEAIFDRMVEGVLILSAEGRVRFVNAAVESLFGVTQDVRNKTLIEAIRSHELQEMVAQTRAEGHVTGHELMLGSASESRYFSVNAATFRESESESGVIVIFHDLTRIKQLESGRKEFVANVSHELRTPLSMIKGYVETLLAGSVEDPAMESRFLQKIEKHSDRLTYLIEDLLALSQLESNQISISQVEINLADLVNRVFDDLLDRAANRSVSLVMDMDPKLMVWVDSDRVQQVLQNLVDNGIKYGKPEGSVSVTAGRSDDGHVVVRVSDDGPGIPEAAREHVFERFFRVDKARSREQGGTGLGLAIVKHIVQAHGGRVWFEAAEPSGAVFAFTLPGRNPGVVE